MATLEQRWIQYKHMEKKSLLQLCEGMNIDVIWKAWKDDIIRTAIDVQDKHAKLDPLVSRTDAVAVTQLITGYESLEPLRTARDSDIRAEHYELFTKNDLVTRCRDLKISMSWKSSRANLIRAIVSTEDRAGPSEARIWPIKSTLPPTTRKEDQPMARQREFYKRKSRNYIRRRCKEFGIKKSSSRSIAQLIRCIMEVESKTSGLSKGKHFHIPVGQGEPKLPVFGPATNTAIPAAHALIRQTSHPLDPHSHANHEGITVMYPDQAPTLHGGSGFPVIAKRLDPVYERYRDQTQKPMELSYEPLYRTPRMNEAAEIYNDMSLSQLQAILKARFHTRGIDYNCDTKLDCIDVLLEDDRKEGRLPAAPVVEHALEPGKVMETNPDPEIFTRKPTVMQVAVLRALQTSDQDVESFQLSREAFYEQFSQQEMEAEVHARRIIYTPTVRRQLVKSDMRMFERVRRWKAGLPPRG
ncbi:hypothetical protein V494_05796 [Pseudogymnoascus sp. VKM F-4513 (FW-928)]|nr:hypothetical protein V494_05796 [Pseudogymnoascus sp. VKM F-4513 (FW-928)]